MKKKCYVIVDLDTLEYMKGGLPATLEDADRFETLTEVGAELINYDDSSHFAIYEVTEDVTYKITRVKK